MIFNCDGTPYRLTSSLNQFDPENPEFGLLNQWDEEMIRLGGSPIFYYEVFIQQQTLDPLYREDRGKLFSPIPVQLYAFYEPIPSQNYQNQFGIDAPDEMQFELNYDAVLRTLGRPPKIGSRIFTPHKRENWIIVQRNLDQFKFWGQFRLLLLCQRYQESVSVEDGINSQKQVDFKLNQSSIMG